MDSGELAITNSKMLFGFAMQVFYIIVNLNGTSEDTAACMKDISKSHVA